LFRFSGNLALAEEKDEGKLHFFGTDVDYVAFSGKVDVLLAPTGGSPTVDLSHLHEFIARLEPRLVIPMQFGTSKTDLDILPVERAPQMFSPAQV
jgi:L-ascorbate metabolism protein UlaG (beta-lactamase superfamily)